MFIYWEMSSPSAGELTSSSVQALRLKCFDIPRLQTGILQVWGRTGGKLYGEKSGSDFVVSSSSEASCLLALKFCLPLDSIDADPFHNDLISRETPPKHL